MIIFTIIVVLYIIWSVNNLTITRRGEEDERRK